MVLPPRRADFSHSLLHLTRERNIFSVPKQAGEMVKLERTVSPFQVLKEILVSGVIQGSGNSGYVKGWRTAVCLSEIPLAALHHFTTPPGQELAYGRYRPYGLAFSKRAIFDAGGRPVIYIPDVEGEWIPATEKWRQVRFEPANQIDWTHEREWRVPGDLDLSKLPGLYVLVWTAAEAAEILTVDAPIKKLIRGVLPMEHVAAML
jgi:hypothetical protein